MSQRGVKDGKKRCNCPIHKGAMVPVEQFWVFKEGRRKGKLFSLCVIGSKLQRGRDPAKSGFVEWTRVRFIFEELHFRIGKTETTRRLGVSANFWRRSRRNKFIRKITVYNAIHLLRELRKGEIARSKHSIRTGAYLRGRPEREPRITNDYNGPNNQDVEYRRNWAKQNPDKQAALDKKHAEQKRAKTQMARAISK